jgi:hypothetical protein
MEWLLKWNTSGWPVTAGSKRTPNRRRKLDAFPGSSASNDGAPDARRSLDDFVRSQVKKQKACGSGGSRSLNLDTTAAHNGFSFRANFLS